MAPARRALFAALALPGVAAASQDLRLEVAGAIAPPSPRWLDMAGIEAAGLDELVTRTPWTQGPQNFGGVPLERVLAMVGARGATLRAVALNDYAGTMPVAETVADGAFLATRLDGMPLPVRQRGPFWIVFPWTSRPDLDDALRRQRAVWQLRRLEVL